jgi:uncharacterized membrane protein
MFNARMWWGICVPVLALGSRAGAQTFQVLELPKQSPGGQAYAVSANGLYITGLSIDSKTGAMLATVWNEMGQPTTLTPYGKMNIGHAISDSGDVVAGEADGVAVIWGALGGDAILGPGAALGLTPDGLNAVGRLELAPGFPIGFWRLTAAVVFLPPEGDDTFSSGNAIASTDEGAVIAGSTSHFEGKPPEDSFFSRAAVWSGFTPTHLAPLPGATVSGANGISADGAVVVGFSAEPGEFSPATAVRWAGGAPAALTPGEFSNALDVSADGQVVVGEGVDGAFVWDPTHGVRVLRRILIDAGINLEGIALTAARSVSADGNVVVGWGVDLDTSSEIAWRATLSGGPECAADFNRDSELNSQDFFDFLVAFFAAEPSADFNADARINSQDFFDFLAAFFEGC